MNGKTNKPRRFTKANEAAMDESVALIQASREIWPLKMSDETIGEKATSPAVAKLLRAADEVLTMARDLQHAAVLLEIANSTEQLIPKPSHSHVAYRKPDFTP